MPTMPRISKKATKIAFTILGIPAPLRKPKNKNRRVNERLIFEETARVR